MHRFVLSLLLLTVLSPAAGAQSRSDSSRGPQLSGAFGLHYGTPLRFSVTAGGVLELSRHRDDGVIALVEQGQHGHAFSLGYVRMFGRFGSGVSLRGTVLRTAGEPWNADPHSTYVGAEMQWMLAFGVGARGGYFRRASAVSTGTNATIATLGFSLGA